MKARILAVAVLVSICTVAEARQGCDTLVQVVVAAGQARDLGRPYSELSAIIDKQMKGVSPDAIQKMKDVVRFLYENPGMSTADAAKAFRQGCNR